MDETWKKVPAAAYYEVSNLGRVRSVDRQFVNARGYKVQFRGVVLRQQTSKLGYKMISIREDDGGRYFRTVHRLVAKAFLKGGGGLLVCHRDGDKTNNKLENLRFDTRAGNILDDIANGVTGAGERNSNARLEEWQVLEILHSKLVNPQIALKYGVSTSLVQAIRSRRLWKHLIIPNTDVISSR